MYESLHAAVQVIYSRRQLHDVTILMGMVICAAAAKALKALLKHTRYTMSNLHTQMAQTLSRAVLGQALP